MINISPVLSTLLLKVLKTGEILTMLISFGEGGGLGDAGGGQTNMRYTHTHTCTHTHTYTLTHTYTHNLLQTHFRACKLIQ